MLTNAQAQVPGLSRSDKTRIVTYAKEAWAEAQQKESTLSIHTKKVSMDGGNSRFFPKIFKRQYAVKNYGTVKTPDTAQNVSMREIITQEFHDALSIDPGDLIGTATNILENAKSQMMPAQGRLIDQIILSALVSPARETTSQAAANRNSALGAHANFIKATVDTETQYKNSLWVKSIASTGVKTFESDDLDNIRYIFSIREIDSSICCTLTPELELILRKDANFINAENRFTAAIGGDPYRSGLMANQRHFMYKGFNFVYTFLDRLPVLSAANIAETATVANLTTTATAQVRGLDVREKGLDSRTTAQTAGAVGANNAGGLRAGTGRATLLSKDVIHFWNPEAVYVASRDDLIFNREDELPLFSYAKQVYSRVSYGAMVIDDAHVLSLALTANVTAIRAS